MTNALVVFKDSVQAKKLGKIATRVKDIEGNVDITYSHDEYDFITIVDTKGKFKKKDLRELGGEMYTKYKDKVTSLTLDFEGVDSNAVAEGVAMAGYTFQRYKTSPKDPKIWPEDVTVVGAEDRGIAESIWLERDLVSEPGNVLFPAEYARRITTALTEFPNVTVKVYHEAQLRDMGFNLLLSVGQGSEKDSYVVVMEYMNGKQGERPLALVGKGVTFDTGGISLKPGRGMGDMKYDMGGSAAVVGAMHAIVSNQLKRNVIGIVGLVENMPDGKAIKPGDVVRSLSGQYVENLNTDAEGRLVLGDILTYVQSEYNPGAIIDLATLTGAIVATLGNEMAGLFTNSDGLEKAIIENGELGGEGFFRMPMGKNWAKMIDSEIADFQNIGGPYGGSTTAAEFLYKFVNKKTAWAHLDIAGMCWSKGGNATTPKGAVGFGVKTLFNIVDNTDSYQWFAVEEKMSY